MVPITVDVHAAHPLAVVDPGHFQGHDNPDLCRVQGNLDLCRAQDDPDRSRVHAGPDHSRDRGLLPGLGLLIAAGHLGQVQEDPSTREVEARIPAPDDLDLSPIHADPGLSHVHEGPGLSRVHEGPGLIIAAGHHDQGPGEASHHDQGPGEAGQGADRGAGQGVDPGAGQGVDPEAGQMGRRLLEEVD